MKKPDLFFDSSALIAGIISATGAARALFLLAEDGAISLIVSEQVIAGTERVVARKAPRALPYYRAALRATGLRVVRDPEPDGLISYQDICSHQPDVPIVVAAMLAGVDFLVSLNRRHFGDDPAVAAWSGLRVGTPGDALTWVRERLTE